MLKIRYYPITCGNGGWIKISIHPKPKREPTGSRFDFPVSRTYSVIFPKLR